MTPVKKKTHQVILPDYWAEACAHLSKRDRIMRRLIAQYPEGCLESRGNAFVTLARSIVGQQISVKAAQSVWDRFVQLVPMDQWRLKPESVLSLSIEQMRSAGLSARKVEYIRDLAAHFADGKIRSAEWQQMDDEAIIAELVAVRGIGRWTAEMFLIFHMFRPDVFPLDDVGLIKGISQVYFSGEPVSRAEARELGEAWTPYRTVATWYIWRSLDPLPVAY
ncbi:DNA-3-methyladenine glycosylase [Saezia sanguinis]|uniref:DNA-3-methyladenine glycosylase II n=1 Tax=Saezia sanguinis TaxID=1965230 RepID=A0A433SGP3_9BURK|nr:DNA-3-methyladenine glycosylase [Saezia sanguinis]RUS67824.1 DNA-3-methyladenine glycosylase [Saezia sanguinis]